VITTVPIGQAAQAIVYVPNAVPEGDGLQGLQPLGLAGQAVHLALAVPAQASAGGASKAPTSVTLFDQGLLQVVQAAVTGLEPKQPYILALSRRRAGDDALEPLSTFMTNPAGSAIVNAVGPIRQVVRDEAPSERRYLVIAPGTAEQHAAPVQIQVE
jgi:hypothetical protein